MTLSAIIGQILHNPFYNLLTSQDGVRPTCGDHVGRIYVKRTKHNKDYDNNTQRSSQRAQMLFHTVVIQQFNNIFLTIQYFVQ